MSQTISHRIEGELTIYRAAELHGVLTGVLAGLAEGGELEVDLSAVTEMDSAGVQLLVAARKSALASRRRLRLAAQSAAVTEVLEILQLAPYFADAPADAPLVAS